MNPDRRWPRGWTSWQLAIVLGLLVVASGSMVYGVVVGMRDGADLDRRADEVAMYRDGVDPYIDQQDMTYPPSALPVFAATVPVGSVTLRRTLWIAFNVAAIFVMSWVFATGTWSANWPGWVQVAMPLIVAASKATRGGMALGQFHLIPVAFVLGAEALGRYPAIAGVLVGIALIKPTMAVPYVLLLLVLQRWRTVVVAAAVQLLLFAITSWQLRLSPVFLTREWLRNASAQNSQGTIDLPSLLLRFAPSQTIRPALISLVVLMIAAVLFVRLRRKTQPGLVALSTLVAAIFTYHRHYDLVLLLPSLAYLVGRAARTSSRGLALFSAAMAVMIIFPSSSRLLGRWEPFYELAFLIACYAILVTVVVCVAREPDRRPIPSD